MFWRGKKVVFENMFLFLEFGLEFKWLVRIDENYGKEFVRKQTQLLKTKNPKSNGYQIGLWFLVLEIKLTNTTSTHEFF